MCSSCLCLPGVSLGWRCCLYRWLLPISSAVCEMYEVMVMLSCAGPASLAAAAVGTDVFMAPFVSKMYCLGPVLGFISIFVSLLLLVRLSYAKTWTNVGLYLMLGISRVFVAKGRRQSSPGPLACSLHGARRGTQSCGKQLRALAHGRRVNVDELVAHRECLSSCRAQSPSCVCEHRSLSGREGLGSWPYLMCCCNCHPEQRSGQGRR